ncbi:MAG: twin-arginine translocase subunit TatC [Actinomycetota bacterium]|nr:twin-arginine translocase subunit TatC [Actinomycetota bacterium]
MKPATMPFTAHLGELRQRLIKSVIAVAIGTIVAFIFSDQILDILVEPYRAINPDAALATFRPTEAFSVVMRLSLWGGAIIASPIITFQVWRFVAPALSPREKRWAIPVVAVLAFLFLLGVGVGYLALERGLSFLLDFGGDALVPVIGADFYLKFAMRFLLAFGIAFQFPVFLFAGAAFGLVTSQRLRSSRRWMVVIILIAAALITPSGDPLTLMMLAVPLYILYELAILAIRFILRK